MKHTIKNFVTIIERIIQFTPISGEYQVGNLQANSVSVELDLVILFSMVTRSRS